MQAVSSWLKTDNTCTTLNPNSQTAYAQNAGMFAHHKTAIQVQQQQGTPGQGSCTMGTSPSQSTAVLLGAHRTDDLIVLPHGSVHPGLI